MNAVTSPRARLVDLLWQLKQAYDNGEDQSDVRFIHFNTLLNDDVYRTEIVSRAVQSSNRKIRELGQKLRDLNREGALLHTRSSGQPAGVPLIINPDIRDTLQQRSVPASPSRRAWRPWLQAALALLGLVGIALLGYNQRDILRIVLDGQQTVRGEISGQQTWSANRTWVLDGLVFVTPGSSLTLEPGTRVLGRPGSALIVTRGAQLYARGSADKPVVFSSAQPVGSRRAGDWGGVVLLGSAPVNVADARIEGIPDSDSRGAFGGDDPASSCGLLEYTRIEFAGYEISRDNELNGLTLGGCGEGTIVRHVQVHRGMDDGIEVFGGTVDMQHIVITGADDDSLDWDMGWQGRVQFLIIEQYASVGDNAFEGDNNKKSPDATPRSAPQIYNATLVSPRSREKHHRAMTLRHGTGGEFRNFIITGFSGEAIDIGGSHSAQQAINGGLLVANSLFHDIGARGRGWFEDEQMDRDDDNGFDEQAFFSNALLQNSFGVDPLLPRQATSLNAPDFSPSTRSPTRNNAAPVPKGEFWDEAADYLGAIRPGTVNSWADGWTDYPLY